MHSRTCVQTKTSPAQGVLPPNTRRGGKATTNATRSQCARAQRTRSHLHKTPRSVCCTPIASNNAMPLHVQPLFFFALEVSLIACSTSSHEMRDSCCLPGHYRSRAWRGNFQLTVERLGQFSHRTHGSHPPFAPLGVTESQSHVPCLCFSMGGAPLRGIPSDFLSPHLTFGPSRKHVHLHPAVLGHPIQAEKQPERPEIDTSNTAGGSGEGGVGGCRCGWAGGER